MSYSKTPSYSSVSSIGTASGRLRPPRPSSAYQRTIESHRSHCVDLDTFDVPSPLTSPSSRNSLSSYLSSPSEDKQSKRLHRTPSGANRNDPDLPDLGEVDLSDGKNTERPQRFKATLYFTRKGKANHQGSPNDADDEDNDKRRSQLNA